MYAIQIDQPTALEWGLNCQQAMVFSVIHQLPTWASSIQIEGETWYYLSKGKLIQELPMLTDKPDTAWRYMKQLQKIGVIDITKVGPKNHVRVTEKGRAWNRVHYQPPVDDRKDIRDADENPQRGNNSESRNSIHEPDRDPAELGKVSEANTEKFPTNEYYQVHEGNQDQVTHGAANCATQNAELDASDSPPRYITAKKRTLQGENLENFLMFWEAFAYKLDKAKAADAWLNVPWARKNEPGAQEHNRDLLMQILTAAAFEASRRQAKADAGTTPIYAEGWLNRRRWEDEHPDLMAQRQLIQRQTGAPTARESKQERRDRMWDALRNIHDTSWAEPSTGVGQTYEHAPN
nr:hypothetical protein 8 [Saccharospirillaceae bacterium]